MLPYCCIVRRFALRDVKGRKKVSPPVETTPVMLSLSLNLWARPHYPLCYPHCVRLVMCSRESSVLVHYDRGAGGVYKL